MALHPGISRAEYEALPGINWTALKQGHGRTGMHIEAALAKARQSGDTPAFKFGRALHMSILQPDLFATEWTIKPGVKTTTEAGKLSESEMATITAMAGRFRSLGYVISSTELALTWEHDGYACKGSIDAICEDGMLLDLKSTDDASPSAMATTVWRYAYHGQMAWYRRGLTANGLPVPSSRIIALEKAAPYAVGQFILNPYTMQRGEAMADKLLALYRDRQTADYGVQDLPVPNWALDSESPATGE